MTVNDMLRQPESPVDDLLAWCSRALALGADAAKPLAPGLVVTADWVRLKCRFGCDGYAQCRTCPPLSPTPSETRRLLDEYSRALLLRVGPHTGRDDSDRRSADLRYAAVELERELFLAGYHRAFSLGAGPCELCGTCDMERPCVDPEHARPSMESCGIDVFATVRNADWEIEVVRDASDAYRFFALVLVD
jgi:predicted metal-binding protein